MKDSKMKSRRNNLNRGDLSRLAKMLVSLILLSSLHSCDPCLDTDCNRGYCNEGTCVCDPGYYGQDCSLQEKKEPTGYVITGVEITNFPDCWTSGKVIDGQYAGDLPDLYVEVYNSSSGTFKTTQSYDSRNHIRTGLSWIIKSLNNNTFIRVYDVDDLGAVTANERLLSIGVSGEKILEERDNVFSTDIRSNYPQSCFSNSEKSWVRIYFELIY